MMILRTTVGVFVNLLVDNKSRLMFKNKSGVTQMVNILTVHGHDWILAMLVCQALWNFCIDTANLYELVSETEIHELLSILADSLGNIDSSNLYFRSLECWNRIAGQLRTFTR